MAQQRISKALNVPRSAPGISTEPRTLVTANLGEATLFSIKHVLTIYIYRYTNIYIYTCNI